MKKTIDKIKKLLRLAESSNPHEAALAMERATDLMTKHDIAMSSVKIDDDSEVTNNVDKTTVNYSMEHDPLLQEMAQRIAVLCSCDVYRIKTYMRRNLELAWVGDPEHRETAQVMFEYLLSSWKKQVARDLHGEKRSKITKGYVWGQKETIRYKESHLHGYCSVLCNKIEKMIADRKKALEEAKTSLVPVNNAIEEFMINEGVRTGRAAPVYSRSQAGYSQGQVRGAGQDIYGRHV